MNKNAHYQNNEKSAFEEKHFEGPFRSSSIAKATKTI